MLTVNTKNNFGEAIPDNKKVEKKTVRYLPLRPLKNKMNPEESHLARYRNGRWD